MLFAARSASKSAGRRAAQSSWGRTIGSVHGQRTPQQPQPLAVLGRAPRLLGTDHSSFNYSRHHQSYRLFATSTSQDKEDEGKEAKATKDDDQAAESAPKEEATSQSTDSLRDTVNRLKNKNKDEASETSSPGDGDLLHRAANLFDSFTSEVSAAWQELLKSGERKHINKQIIKPEATAEGDKEYTGPVDIMVIDPNEHLTAWERMQRRLTEAPIIQRALEHSDEFLEKTGAKKAKKKLDHLSEDAREAWETSQNPWVYRASSVYDTFTAESPETAAVRELRKLDPEFTLEDWRQDVVELTLPQVMEWFLQGKVNQLKPWLGEGVFHRIASEIAARKQEGVQIDTHVLGIMNSEILAVEVCFDVFGWFGS